MSTPLSVQLYTLRDDIERDLPATLQALADRGFDEVELFGFPARADEYAAALARTGLTAPTVHARLLTEGVDVPAVLDAAARIGARTVIDPYVPAERWTTARSVEATAHALNTVAEQAAGYGLTVGYHNHWWETEYRLGSLCALEHLARHLDQAVVLEVDTYWALVGGIDPAPLLGRLGSRVTAIHLKDGALTKDATGQTPLGEGAVPVEAIVSAAPDARRVIEFDHYDGDIWAAIDASRQYLNRLAAL
ncbi:sugar phosphate isomerase/epimerase family protein [Jiangella endophytica]|uniref:sugar phosphate isomerase/epimerase family protein n=1 Tax=Jiangella endophytica TaxID=1623398 RepID=UPI000E34A1B6|nr:sugar phosphate isomerase/epimerase [Jiangella endophytica]